MTTLTMRNTKAELFAAIQELQAQLTSVTEQLAQAKAAKPQATEQPSTKPQAPARPVTDRGAILSIMREFAIANKCPTRLRDGVAQYYSYQVNAWLAI